MSTINSPQPVNEINSLQAVNEPINMQSLDDHALGETGMGDMNDLNPVFLPMLVSSRWAEAMAETDPMKRVQRLCSLVSMVENELRVIEQYEPDHILVSALRGISADAHAHYLALMPRMTA